MQDIVAISVCSAATSNESMTELPKQNSEKLAELLKLFIQSFQITTAFIVFVAWKVMATIRGSEARQHEIQFYLTLYFLSQISVPWCKQESRGDKMNIEGRLAVVSSHLER